MPSRKPSRKRHSRTATRAMHKSDQRNYLRSVASETLRDMSLYLKDLKLETQASKVVRYDDRTPRLEPLFRPLHAKPAIIEVVNSDTLNAALDLARTFPKAQYSAPAAINFADTHKPGGGWRNGAMAQEESICYRSSLAWSLESKPSLYPLQNNQILYSPTVVVAREDMASNHRWISSSPLDFPVISVISVAALRNPRTAAWDCIDDDGKVRKKHTFVRDDERLLTKLKMRLVLRTAWNNGHTMLVLGALGCGVFRGPPDDIAHCWLEVLREDEFSGNRWSQICFAVYDPQRQGNYETFKRILQGWKV